MNILDWLRGRSRPPRNDADEAQASTAVQRPQVDPETGEILEHGGTTDSDPGPAPDRDSARQRTVAAVAGERTIPSVNRERSVHARVSSALAIGTVALLGGGFLLWYYATQFARAHDAKTAAEKVAEARAGGEMKLPPLGRVDPPQAGADTTPVSAGGLLGPAPPAPQADAFTSASGTQSGPPAKTPEQLALERMLAEPVLLRSRAAPSSSGAAPYPPAMPLGALGPPNLAAIMSAAAGGTIGPDGQPQANSPASLASMLRATPTPAVVAQVLPSRRFLLPKGAFIDCTLETAIDSTLDGMVTCIGASDIYSADGKVVLLERGTKYVGEKRGEVRHGQGRVFVLWNEARTPTGVVVALTSPGTDELGRAGLPGFVDTHFWDRFGAAILISVIDGSLQALAASQQRGGGGTAVVLSPQGSREVLTEVLKSTISIPPSVIKNQGDRVQVLVARDVDFRAVYALRSEPDGQ
jgi:type IV secretion system protein VirB10